MTIVKPLGELLGHWLTDSDLADIAISGLSIDSRRVVKGDLFFAYPGGTSDGRDYIDDAVDHGACLVLYETDGCVTPPEVSVPVVPMHALRKKVASDKFTIDINLNLCEGEYTIYSSDLSPEYVDFNRSEYAYWKQARKDGLTNQ